MMGLSARQLVAYFKDVFAPALALDTDKRRACYYKIIGGRAMGGFMIVEIVEHRGIRTVSGDGYWSAEELMQIMTRAIKSGKLPTDER
jgi:hypothetical protein